MFLCYKIYDFNINIKNSGDYKNGLRRSMLRIFIFVVFINMYLCGLIYYRK